MADTRPTGPSPDALRAEIMRQVTERGDEKSICPSEVARAYGEDWQRLMGQVRDAAKALSREGKIDILRKGRPVEPDAIRGVIRLRLRPDGAAPEPDAEPE